MQLAAEGAIVRERRRAVESLAGERRAALRDWAEAGGTAYPDPREAAAAVLEGRHPGV